MAGVLSNLHRVFARTYLYVSVVCGVMFFLYMLNVVGDVAGRYLFLSPILGTVEIGESVLAVAVFMTMAAVQLNKENIRVTLLPDRLSDAAKAWLDMLTSVCCLAFMVILTWQSFILAERSFAMNETGINLPIPLYIGKFAFFVGGVLLCLQFAFELVCQVYERVTGTAPVKKEVKS